MRQSVNTDPNRLHCRNVLWCSIARSNVQLRNAEPACSDSAAEIAFVEHHTLGSQPAQVVVTETMTDVFAFDPDCFGVVHAVSRAAV
jgi:hypothetical protein